LIKIVLDQLEPDSPGHLAGTEPNERPGRRLDLNQAHFPWKNAKMIVVRGAGSSAEKRTMSKNWIETLEKQFLENAGEAASRADHAIHDIVEHHHYAHWHPASTAPCNQDLELRVLENRREVTLAFPCMQTNAGEWLNVDLGTRIEITPVHWRIWQHSKSPEPHHSPMKSNETLSQRFRNRWIRKKLSRNRGP
jgi:hypothetical protein